MSDDDKVVPINRKEKQLRDEKLQAENVAWADFGKVLKRTIYELLEAQEKENRKAAMRDTRTDEEKIIDKVEKEAIGKGIEDDE